MAGKPKKNAEDTTEEAKTKKASKEDYYIDANYILERKTETISFCPTVDAITGGGVHDGSIVVIGGSPGLGKTSYGLGIIANAQKQGRIGGYVNIEERLEASLLKSIYGLDLSPDKFKILTSTPGSILSAEEYLDRTERLLTQFPGIVVLFDSLSDLCTADERTKDYGSGYNVAARKLEAEFMRRCAPILSVNRSILIGIAHTTTSMGYTGTSDKVSRETEYKTNLKIRCTKANPFEITSGNKVIGHKLEWTIIKNSYGPPKEKAVSHLRYGFGPDYLYDLIVTAVDVGIIEKSGAWLKVPGQEKQFQGMERVYEFLTEDEKSRQEISKQVRGIFNEI